MKLALIKMFASETVILNFPTAHKKNKRLAACKARHKGFRQPRTRPARSRGFYHINIHDLNFFITQHSFAISNFMQSFNIKNKKESKEGVLIS